MVPADAASASSPAHPFHSPRPRQITKLSMAAPTATRSSPHSPHTPTHLAHPSNMAAAFNPDGSLSVLRNDDDANNSGLLDLSPAFSRMVKSRPNFGSPRGDSTPSSKPLRRVQTGTKPKSRLSIPVVLSDLVHSSQPADDHMHTDPLAPNGAAPGTSVAAHPSTSMHMYDPLAPDAAADDDLQDVSDDHDDAPASTLTRLRRWRQDAMQQHLYDTAIFWSTKLLSLETTAAAYNDAYHLAQCYFYTHQYARAEHLLTNPLRIRAPRSQAHPPAPTDAAASSSAKHTGAEGFLMSDNVQDDDDALHDVLQRTRSASILPPSIMARSSTKDSMYSATSSTTGKRKKRDYNLSANGSSGADSASNPADSDDDTHDASAATDRDGSVLVRAYANRRSTRPPADTTLDLQPDVDAVRNASVERAHGPVLVNHSLACRYLAAQCQVRLAKYHEALDLLGETEHWGASASNRKPATDGGIKLGSSVAFLRGQIHLRLEDLPRARDAFMAALALDVKNYQAFAALVDGEMLGTDEQWAFVQGLEYAAQAGDEPGAREDYELVRLLYTTQLSKQARTHAATTAAARRRLVAEYALDDDPDVLCGLAAELIARLRYSDAFVVTSRVLELAADHPTALPIHIACTYHLKNLRPALFMLAHRLTELQPESPVSWYAVGTWYATTRRWAEARRYFSKASLLDPRFAPGWIAFGHTFALEGESDQAVIAYSTAARLFPQSHLPKLFVGMEHLHQDNLSLARLSLDAAAAISTADPLLANERGIVAFQTGDLVGAVGFFEKAIELARETQQPAAAWKASYLNLGVARMRLGRDKAASEALQAVVELDPHSYQAHLCLGMLAHKHDRLDDAVQHYHEALSIHPRDAHATELLDFVLDEKVHYGVNDFAKYDPDSRLRRSGDQAAKGKQRQQAVAQSVLKASTQSASPTRTAPTHHPATPQRTPAHASMHSAGEMSLDTSASHSHTAHTDADQSSVLMDESTS